MEINEASQIIRLLNDNFDSHDFIRELYVHMPSVYGVFLVRHNNVNTAHAEISNFLRFYSNDLEICEMGKVVSLNIFGKPSECAQWGKL